MREPGGRRPRVDAARAAAYDVLRAVHTNDAYSNLALPGVLSARGLAGRDAAFATELVAGTLRRQGSYDAILAACVDRPLRKVQAKVLDVLRLGAHQLLGMRVPRHAAISTTVDLARLKAGARAGGFTNAVLRRVADHGLAAWVDRIGPDRTLDPVGYAEVAYSHPRWVISALAAALGERAEELDALLAADNVTPDVVLAVRPGRAGREEIPGAPTDFSPYGVRLAGGDPASLAAVLEGRAGVQDEGSQLVAVAAAAAPVGGRDRFWLDMCAGPGGKAALWAALATEPGREATVLAAELAPHRAALVRQAVAGLPGLGGVIVADGREPPWRQDGFDRVLVDAPCTGLGALRRRPEARWRRQPADLDTLVPLQRDLLRTALTSVRPGGIVTYATCSPVLAETAEVVTEALADGRAEVVEAGPLLGVPDSDGPIPGTVQLWPHRHRSDAMFIAVLRRPGGQPS